MSKAILTVGCSIASEQVDGEEFASHASLLDYDIILFSPNIDALLSGERDTYKGKICPDDDTSFSLRDYSEHWRREIRQAVDAGKLVIVFLSPLREIMIATGQRQQSGTGRNRSFTRIVEPFTNYSVIPEEFDAVKSEGYAIKLAAGSEFFSNFWSVFQHDFKYHATLSLDRGKPLLLTRSGEKTVGAVFRSAEGSGAILILPEIDFSPDEFFVEDDEGDFDWTPAARQFGERLVSALVALDKSLKATTEESISPDWTSDQDFELSRESDLRAELLIAEQGVREAQLRKERLTAEIAEAGRSRRLLFEKGKALEEAIIRALHHLGFEAAGHKDAVSEFDVVFESAEGRFLGEAEGKDNKAVGVDKLRQLAMNLHEDLQREEVTELAKGVLFGNGFRLTRPSERTAHFTEKCISAAETSSVALVATADLFRAVQHLLAEDDEHFARACREAILGQVGLVMFPAVPATRHVKPDSNERAI